jgi:hypothetical protein
MSLFFSRTRFIVIFLENAIFIKEIFLLHDVFIWNITGLSTKIKVFTWFGPSFLKALTLDH